MMNACHERRALARTCEVREKKPVVGEWLEALADHDQPVARERSAECGVGRPLRAARQRHGAPVRGADLPAVQRAAIDFIREIQRIDDRSDAGHRHRRQCNDRDLRGARSAGFSAGPRVGSSACANAALSAAAGVFASTAAGSGTNRSRHARAAT